MKGKGSRQALVTQYREGRADIAAAGLGEDLQKVQYRARESLKKAAKALAWLNISPEMLGGWVEAHLEAYSRGDGSFSMAPQSVTNITNIIVDEAGQFALFRG